MSPAKVMPPVISRVVGLTITAPRPVAVDALAGLCCAPESVAERTTVVQVIVTLVMLVAPTVPVPLATAQFCAAFTVTAYAAPTASPLAKVKLPGAASVMSPPPLICSTTLPAEPATVPPTV